MEERELKECLFCGNSDLSTDYWPAIGHRVYSVVCDSCGAAGPLKLSISQAKEAWNTRQPEFSNGKTEE